MNIPPLHEHTPPQRLSFSTQLPTHQLAWDSTSLGALKWCPRYYQYSIVEGWVTRNESVHLTFGLHLHAALEHYDHQRADGIDHITAMRATVHRLLLNTWDKTKNRPWTSDDPNKNRLTLVRSVVWYLDQFANDPMTTIQLANGQPAVELSFRFDANLQSSITNEPLLLCGHLDRLAQFNDSIWIVDRKTTKYALSPEYFARYSPDNQFSLYALAGRLVFNTPVAGLMVDAIQVGATFSRFQRGTVQRTPEQLSEWLRDLTWWVESAGQYAVAGYWPQNDRACGMYGGCPYRSICGRSPLVRDQWLKASYTNRIWDPLQVRGDI